MPEISLLRLYVLRAMYLFVVLGLGSLLLSELLDPAREWSILKGQTSCMLGAFWGGCLLGLRYPVQLLPMLLWEATWKTLWLLVVPIRQWLQGQLDPALLPDTFACGLVVLVYAAVPWPYVYAHYVRAPGNRWR